MYRFSSWSGQSRRLALPTLAVLLALGGCGGGDAGVASAPAPLPPVTPTVTPTATPAAPSPPVATLIPAETFRTAEYNRSDGPTFHSVIPAWQTGASGKGVTLGIVDTGIDTANTEFAGRIAAASRDVVSARGLTGPDSHGTQVALLAAAARDSSGILGIAYDATILMARADDPGSCGSGGGCTFSDGAIATGVDLAVANGARVINISLGGSGANSRLVQSVANAANAGVVVVIAAGNGGAANPNAFAAALRRAGSGKVIIAGSVNGQNTISSFSNRAGSEAGAYLAALGEQVCCVYDGSQIKVTTDSTGQTFITVLSGTSFAAPQIAGAAALLLQAFPALSAQDVVDLLLSSATDAGTAGTDITYGRGILNIASAFAAKGTTTLAGTGAVLMPADSSLITSAAMGDAVQTATLRATVLDAYRRAYTLDLGRMAQRASVSPRLGAALLGAGRPVALANRDVALAFTTGSAGPRTAWAGSLRLSGDDATAARVLASRIVARIAPGMDAAFGLAEGADGLAAQLRGAPQPAFLVAPAAADDLGFARTGIVSSAVRFGLNGIGLGAIGLTVSADSGRVMSNAGRSPLSAMAERDAPRISRFGLTLDRRFGDLGGTIAASWLSEDRSVLGARLAPALDPGGADSLLLDLGLNWQASPHWAVSGNVRRGFTRARPGALLKAGSRLASSAWNLDLVRRGLFSRDDSLALRLSQPLRVDHGGLNLLLPTAWDYATLRASGAAQRLSLTPSGRELDAELGWTGMLGGGTASATLFWRHEPGHIRALPDERGAALRWGVSF